MRTIGRTLIATLLLMLASTGPVSAHETTAWVLWSNTLIGTWDTHDVLTTQDHYLALEGFPTYAACVAATAGKPNGYATVHPKRFERLTFSCLPASVDPRGPR
jgi:hypothetical protein